MHTILVVLYNRKCEDSGTIAGLLSNPPGGDFRCIVFDNTENDRELIAGNRDFCLRHGFTYFGSGENTGLSRAYNYVLDHLPENETGYLILFDDDTHIGSTYFTELRMRIRAGDADILLPRVYAGGKLISPCLATGRKSGFRRIDDVSGIDRAKITAINSGMAVRLPACRILRYNEELFLDFVDHDFMARARRHGFRIRVMDCAIRQGYSRMEDVPAEQALSRFRIYQNDLKAFSRIHGNRLGSRLSLVKHALAGTAKYRSPQFLAALAKGPAGQAESAAPSPAAASAGRTAILSPTDAIIAAVVTYNPEVPLLGEVLAALLPQAGGVVIYDNASENAEEIEALLRDFPAVRLIKNTENLGLPVNYNRAAALAKEEGFPWLLLMDQDTVIPEGMTVAFMNYTAEDDVAIISPVIWDTNSADEEEVRSSLPDEPVTKVRKCLSSASLNRVDTILSLGGFDEKLFIDWVDLDFCKNVDIHGYRILRVNSCIVRHRLGNAHIITARFLWKKRTVESHEPSRYYTIYRNWLYFTRKYRAYPEEEPGVFLTRANLMTSLLWRLYEDEPLRKFGMAMKGILGGMTMRVDPPAVPAGAEEMSKNGSRKNRGAKSSPRK